MDTQKGTFQAKKLKFINFKENFKLNLPFLLCLRIKYAGSVSLYRNDVVTLKLVRYKDDITKDDVLQLTAFCLTDRVVMTDLECTLTVNTEQYH